MEENHPTHDETEDVLTVDDITYNADTDTLNRVLDALRRES
jgi:hypothetical protein